jgi:hypothetical protein
MVAEVRPGYPSDWPAIRAVAAKLGIADGLVGSTVRAMGRIGYGVIARRVPPTRAPADGLGIPEGAAGQAVIPPADAGGRNTVITGCAVSASLAAGEASRPARYRMRPGARCRRGWCCCRPARR